MIVPWQQYIHVGVFRWGEAGTKVQLLKVGVAILDVRFASV